MGVTVNKYDQPTGPSPTGWTKTETAPAGTHAGTRIETTGGELHYKHGTDTLVGPNAFLLEAVLSAQALPADGERGARLWVRFTDALAPPMGYLAEVQLHRSGLDDQIKLYDGNSGLEKASLNQPWSAGPIRVRIKRQEIAGQGYLFLQAEPSSGWDDPLYPNETYNPPKSVGVQITGPSGFSPDMVSPADLGFGFGNFLAGSYYSDWHSVHWTQCDANADVLPYWPPAATLTSFTVNAGPPRPPTPEEVEGDVDSTVPTYLTDDVTFLRVTSPKDGTKDSFPTTSTGGVATHAIGGFTDDQNVTGTAMAMDVSGRATPSSPGTALTIPNLLPAQPTIDSPTPAYFQWTNDPQQQLTGTAEANATLHVYQNGVLVDSFTVPAGGSWTWAPSAPLPDTTYAFEVQAEDSSGNKSPLSATLNLEVLTSLPAGEILISTNINPPTFNHLDYGTPPLTINQRFHVALRVDADTFDRLDYDYLGNPFYSRPPPGYVPPSKLMIAEPGSGPADHMLSSQTGEFTIHSVGGTPPTDHYFVIMDTVTAKEKIFELDGAWTLQAFLEDLATNQATIPALPVTINAQIPPEVLGFEADSGSGYVPLVSPITARPVVPAVTSVHGDVDLTGASTFKITEIHSGQVANLTVAAKNGASPSYRYDPSGLATDFPAGARLNMEGTFEIEVTLRDSAGNAGATVTSPQFVVDTSKPSALILVTQTSGSNYGALTSNYPVGTYYVGLAILASTTDLDEANSTFNIQPPGGAVPIKLNAATKVSNVSYLGITYTVYEWPAGISGNGLHVIDYELLDVTTGLSAGAQTGSFIIGGTPQFSLSTMDLGVSHTHDDGTNLDTAGEIYNGSTSNNYLGVRIHNSGTGVGDCSFRMFVIPKCLFTSSANWKLVHHVGSAPVVPNIPPGNYGDSKNNVNYQQGVHPNFDNDDTLFGPNSQIGDICHTCTCAVLHSAADPLELKNASGGTVPITSPQFDDPGLFKTDVMDVIQNYNGGTYWTAVSSNPKIANRNFNYKKVV